MHDKVGFKIWTDEFLPVTAEPGHLRETFLQEDEHSSPSTLDVPTLDVSSL